MILRLVLNDVCVQKHHHFSGGLRNAFVALLMGIDKMQCLCYNLAKSDYRDDGAVVMAKRMAELLL